MPSLPPIPAPPIVTGSKQVTGIVFVINTISGLEPGRKLEQTFSFTPDDNPDYPRYYGGTAAEANDDGVIFAFDQIGWLCQGQTGIIRGWWREPGSSVFGDPIPLPDGTAEIRIRVPG